MTTTETYQSSKFSDAPAASDVARLHRPPPPHSLHRIADAPSHPCRAFFHSPKGAVGAAARGSLTVRDVIAWAQFCAAAASGGALSPWRAYVHGAYLTLLDGLGLGLGMPESEAATLRAACEDMLRAQLPGSELDALQAASFAQTPPELRHLEAADDAMATTFGVAPFLIEKVRVTRNVYQTRLSAQ